MDLTPPKEALNITPFVAVYGTLKYGFPNHYLLESAEAVGVGYIAQTFRVFDVGFPYAVPSKKGFPLQVEVYKVPRAGVLEELDILEGYPHHYKRRPLEVLLRNGKSLTAWIYYVSTPRGEELKELYRDERLAIDFITWKGSFLYPLELLVDISTYGGKDFEEILRVLVLFLKTYGGPHRAVSPFYRRAILSLLSRESAENPTLLEFLKEVYRLVSEGEIEPIPPLEEFISKI